MLYDKPFKTIQEQIDILRSRGLRIIKTKTAENILMTYPYYDLVNGYKDVFMPNDKFIKNTAIEHLFMFSFIDKNVQSTVFKYSLMVENILKTKLAYIISNKYGVHPDDYLHQKYYKKKVNGLAFTAVKTEIAKQLDIRKASQPTKHYLEHHNHVPAWILFKNISLGSAVNLYKFLSSSTKAEVTNLLIPNNTVSTKEKIEFITNALETIRKFRNISAHNLSFVKCRAHYKMPIRTISNLVDKKYTTGINPSSYKSVYGVVLSLMILLDNAYLSEALFKEFTIRLEGKTMSTQSLLNKYKLLSNIPADISQRI